VQRIELALTYAYTDFITAEESDLLSGWVMNRLHLFKLVQEGQYLGVIADLPRVPRIVKEIEHRLVSLEGLGHYRAEPEYGHIFVVNLPGSALHLHRDPDQPDGLHVRYNCMVKKPTQGGLSIYGDSVNDPPELSLWRCLPNRYLHGSTAVEGGQPRIILSMGYIIPHHEVT